MQSREARLEELKGEEIVLKRSKWDRALFNQAYEDFLVIFDSLTERQKKQANKVLAEIQYLYSVEAIRQETVNPYPSPMLIQTLLKTNQYLKKEISLEKYQAFNEKIKTSAQNTVVSKLSSALMVVSAVPLLLILDLLISPALLTLKVLNSAKMLSNNMQHLTSSFGSMTSAFFKIAVKSCDKKPQLSNDISELTLANSTKSALI